MSSPIVKHWVTFKQILCYLKGSPGQGLLYENHVNTNIECFSYTNWEGSKKNRISITGYCVFVGGNLIYWKNKK